MRIIGFSISSLEQSLNDSYIYDDEKSKKFWRLDSKILKGNVFKLIFKSGKYNHSPNYISRLNGNESAYDGKMVRV